MWTTSQQEFEAVVAAERALMDSSTRSDRDAVERLLAPDFIEIGRSGRFWSRPAIVSALAGEAPRRAPQTSEWRFNPLQQDLVLVTFRVHSAHGDSRHSSLWDLSGHQPVLRFHQGTTIPGAQAS